jgi:hypothetical protein
MAPPTRQMVVVSPGSTPSSIRSAFRCANVVADIGFGHRPLLIARLIAQTIAECEAAASSGSRPALDLGVAFMAP